MVPRNCSVLTRKNWLATRLVVIKKEVIIFLKFKEINQNKSIEYIELKIWRNQGEEEAKTIGVCSCVEQTKRFGLATKISHYSVL